MSNFSDIQITKWANDYERFLVASNNLILDRYSIPIISGQGAYELPNYFTSIRLVLWEGREVYPKGFSKSIATGDSPTSITSSIPLEYTATGKGLRVIKFYPTPYLDIAEYTGDLFTAYADAAAVIIEGYRTPSTTDNNLRLPLWCRRYLLKDHICQRAFANEGKAQDMRAALYYEKRLTENQLYISKIKENMHQAALMVLNAHNNQDNRRRPAKPVLPSNFPA